MLEERNHQTRNLPVYVICPNTRHRIINQVIYEEFIKSLLTRVINWEDKAAERLSCFGINISPVTLFLYSKDLKAGRRDPSSIANFSGQVEGGEIYTSRYGKDSMYKQLKMMVNLWLKKKDWKYIGLPANQILSITKEYGQNNIAYACEKNSSMAEFMFILQRHFAPIDCRAAIIKSDILECLQITPHKFSIYDFDFMCHISAENLINNLVDGVSRTSMNKCIVNIATTIGRKISEEDYKKLMPKEFIRGISKTMNVVNHYSDGYNDRIMPMRYELFMLERKEESQQLELFN
jgi:hypothetical protein